jgi:hypothetical protein
VVFLFETEPPQSVENTIGVNAYQHNKVNQWTSNILEACLKRLAALNKPFKYIGISGVGRTSPPHSCNSHCHHPPEERRRPPHLQLMLLGQLH